jgi:hypothetical protein
MEKAFSSLKCFLSDLHRKAYHQFSSKSCYPLHLNLGGIVLKDLHKKLPKRIRKENDCIECSAESRSIIFSGEITFLKNTFHFMLQTYDDGS